MWYVCLLWPLPRSNQGTPLHSLRKQNWMVWLLFCLDLRVESSLETTDGVGDYGPCFPYDDQTKSVRCSKIMLQFHDNVWNVNFAAYTIEQWGSGKCCVPNLHRVVIHIFLVLGSQFLVLTGVVIWSLLPIHLPGKKTKIVFSLLAFKCNLFNVAVDLGG